MRKDLILVIFPYREAARIYFEDNIKPLMPYLEKKDHFTFESDTYILRLCSTSNSDSLRGYDASLVFLSDECSLKTYNEIILPLVRNQHDKIKVVI